MYRTCQLIVWLKTPVGSPKANTYCQRPAGHEGKCCEYKLIEDHTPEEQKEIISRTPMSYGVKGEEFCVDEGCPHYGTPHVCVEKGKPNASKTT